MKSVYPRVARRCKLNSTTHKHTDMTDLKCGALGLPSGKRFSLANWLRYWKTVIRYWQKTLKQSSYNPKYCSSSTMGWIGAAFVKMPQIQSFFDISLWWEEVILHGLTTLEEMLITHLSFEIPTNCDQIRIKDIKIDKFWPKILFSIMGWKETWLVKVPEIKSMISFYSPECRLLARSGSSLYSRNRA